MVESIMGGCDQGTSMGGLSRLSFSEESMRVAEFSFVRFYSDLDAVGPLRST
jgi:hypothetical protein